MGLARFDLTADPDGTCSMILNGETLDAPIAAGQLSFARDQIPRLTLRMLGGATLSGEGVVEVERDTETQQTRPIGQIVAEWLAEQDPMQLWTLALEGRPMGDHPAHALVGYLQSLALQELR